MRLSLLSLAALLVVGACGDDKDGGGDDSGDPGVDADGDGYTPDDGDCDDADASIHPGAGENCDEIDNDCDDLVDMEDPDITGWGTWYIDVDGDGYGYAGQTADGCTQPDGTSDNALDCDDHDKDISPDAREFCDGDDNDCNGLTDSEDDGVLGEPTWYADLDLDGYGDPATAVEACEQPTDLIATGSDCDDTDANVHPEAEETCADGVDSDCDGWDGPSTVEFGSVISCAQASADGASGQGLGIALASAGDIDDDNFDDVLVGNTDQTVWLVAGPVSGPDAVLEPVAIFTDEAADTEFGTVLGAAGDLDGDGTLDIALGAPGADEAGVNSGAAWVFYGPVTGALTTGDADAVLLGASYGDGAGSAVMGCGDLDDDGVDDLLVGASQVSEVLNRTGAVYLVSGPVTGSIDLADATASFTGDRLAYFIGASLAVPGDINGDGDDDVVAGVPRDESTGTDAGAVYVLTGPVSAGGWAAGYRLAASAAGDTAGTSVVSAGDLDDDGFDDFLVTAPDNDGNGTASGAVYVVHGPVTVDGSLASVSAAILRGADQADNLGQSVSLAGDVDGDDEMDFFVGAPREDWDPGPGTAWLVLGPLSGQSDVHDVGTALTGEVNGDQAGYAVLGGHDLDQDDEVDFLVGAPGANSEAGALYLSLGPP